MLSGGAGAAVRATHIETIWITGPTWLQGLMGGLFLTTLFAYGTGDAGTIRVTEKLADSRVGHIVICDGLKELTLLFLQAVALGLAGWFCLSQPYWFLYFLIVLTTVNLIWLHHKKHQFGAIAFELAVNGSKKEQALTTKLWECVEAVQRWQRINRWYLFGMICAIGLEEILFVYVGSLLTGLRLIADFGWCHKYYGDVLFGSV